MKYYRNNYHPPVVSLVGRSNSGKTTFLEKLIRELKQRGYRVGTVKHHRGTFEFDIEGKDTWRHAQAGADMVALATPTGFGLVKKLAQELSPEEITSYMPGVDIIIVEGMKKGSQPKIELVRSAVADAPVCPVEELMAVVSDLPLSLGLPRFGLDDFKGVADLIENQLIKSSDTAQGNVSSLREDQLKRYHRNIMLPGVGQAGQLKLLNSSVLVVGTGGLGSPVAYYLAAAGIGRLGLADADVVDLSNLQRQILHTTADLNRLKVESAREKLSKLNPDIQIEVYPFRVTRDNVADLVCQYDLVVDATDNFATRYVLNEGCMAAGKPFIYGGVLSMVGQVMTILPGKGPCFRCIFREPPSEDAVKSTADYGILGSVAGIIGCIQATEAVKYLLGQGDLLVGRLLTMEGMSMFFQEVEVKRDPHCPDCGKLE
ncbi:molybdopterin-guanine dinucleotide biosynthesis protein B [Desulfotomaculum nigrificans]|uniref:molybdopterin-guanine dinucleotide biosynthesis protein B n=1 Tax=Desulfotomaculum nigrificans TaxID=1565 RepID=UPI000316BE99|nr:molybdopterin-guanine dinucleotide biosynthesis protein B [Desulfotomaculum nigrificans]